MERISFHKSSFLFLLISAILFFAFIYPVKSFAATFSITANVYYDTNRNGVRDTTETSFPNGNITLSSGQTAVTNASGIATFSNLPVGDYAVSFTNIPAGYKATTSNPVITTIGSSNATANFGIALPATPTSTTTPTATPTPTKAPTPTPTPIPTTGKYGVTSKYCPQGDVSANFCGTTKCDNTGVNYQTYNLADCTYHSWNCSGTGSKTCGAEYSNHYWDSSCDKTNTQRNLPPSQGGGAGPSVPPRCIPPAPPGATTCALNSTNAGYDLHWGAIAQTTYNIYSGGGTFLINVSTNSYSRPGTNLNTFIIKSVGGGRESLKGTVINTCPPVPTATATPNPTPTATPTPTPTPVPQCNSGQQYGTCSNAHADTCNANNGTQSITYTTYNGSTNCTQHTTFGNPCTVNNCNFSNTCVSGVCVSPTPVPTPTPNPTGGPTPTPTPAPKNTTLSFTIGMDGIWSTGDNVNSDASGSNKNPLHSARNLIVQIYNASNTLVSQTNGTINYDSPTGKFTGIVNIGSSFQSGSYTLKVKSDGHLTRQLPGIITIVSGQNNAMPGVNLVAGDINNDNALTILDYNIFLSCSMFSTDNQALCETNSSYAVMSDLDDNGVVDQFDYNLFVREYSVQNGQ